MADYVSEILGLPEPKTVALPVIRQSSVKASERCPRYGLFTRLGIRKHGRTAAFDTGSYGHKILNVMATGGTRQGAITACTQLHNLVIDDLASAPCFGGKRENIGEKTMEDREKDLNLGIATGFAAWAQFEPRIKSGTIKILASERPLDAVIESPSILDANGKPEQFRVQTSVDLDIQLKDGSRAINDLKTLARGADAVKSQQSSLRRMQTWINVLGSRAAGIPVKFLFYTVVQKCGYIRKKASKANPSGESVEQYIKRVQAWIDGSESEERAEEIKTSPPVVISPPIPLPQALPHPIALRLLNTRNWLQADTDWSQYYPHEASCYHNDQECVFAAFCNNPMQDWRGILNDKFTTKPDVLDCDPRRTQSQQEIAA